MKKNFYINKPNKIKGFTLIELILVISIGLLMSFISFQSLMKGQEDTQAKVAGEQIKQLGDSVNSYIAVHYDKLASLTNAAGGTSDPGPRTCNTTTNTCTVTVKTLVNEGLLPTTYGNNNIFNSDYTITLKRSGNSPYYNINGLITTNKPWIGAGNKVRYDLLGKAMQTAGIDSGMTNNSTSKVSGYNGNWSQDVSTFSNIQKSGQLAYQVGYGTYSYSVYLRRDGTLPMTGNLNMGSQSISNTKNITASGTTQSGVLKSTGATTVGTTLNVAGVTTLAGTNVNGALNANNTLTAAGATNLKSTLNIAGATTANGVVNANNALNVAGITTLRNTTSIGGVLNANSNLNVGGTSTLNGVLNANNAVNLKGNTTVNGLFRVNNAITSTGNITSSGQVQGASLVATGRTTVGEFLQLNKVATLNAACSPNGLIGRTSTGSLLSCVNGKWSGVGGGYFKAPPPQTIQCSAKNYKLTKTFQARIDESGQLYSRYYNNAGTDTGWAKGTANAAVDFTGVSGSNSRTVQGGGQSESTSTVSCQGKWVW